MAANGPQYKNAFFGPTFDIGQQMVLYTLYSLIVEKCKLCTYIATAPNGPTYRLIVEKINFCTYFVSCVPNGPL